MSMFPVCVSDFDPNTTIEELRSFFQVQNIDLKEGYAFLYFEEEDKALQAIGYNGSYFGHDNCIISVELAAGERGKRVQQPAQPSRTLYVEGFDFGTSNDTIRAHFAEDAAIVDLRSRFDHAFLLFEEQEGATAAYQKIKNDPWIFGKKMEVEYAKWNEFEG